MDVFVLMKPIGCKYMCNHLVSQILFQIFFLKLNAGTCKVAGVAVVSLLSVVLLLGGVELLYYTQPDMYSINNYPPKKYL